MVGGTTGHTKKPPGPPESSETCWEAPRPLPAEKTPETAGRQRDSEPSPAPADPPLGPGPHLLHLPGQGH